ncbi:MAG: molybdopterin-dependent oxidoreductase [Gemmatimonadaceae bacterium]|nr:molybdopterin-dependent oxidoreductase [Gemmatimonadaceae bacterium]
MEDADVVLLWGSNARAAHPIWFHHLLKGIRHHGTRLYVMDPRRTASAQWADVWCGLRVGSDIALANAMAREIIHAGLHHEAFIANATEGFEAYKAAVEQYTLEYAEPITGIPGDVIREAAHAFARAERAMICWTLGITEHHNAVDNVLALINLALLTGHMGRWGSGCNPLRGQNNVQGGGDMGAIPNKLAGFQDIEQDHEARARFEAAWGTKITPRYGKNLTQMLHAMAAGEMKALLCIGENPMQSDADANHVEQALRSLDHLVVQEIVLTRTAQLADVVLPAAATWCEGEGTVTNSERRVQRVRKAAQAPEGARDELWILSELARRMGHDWATPTANEVWDEVRRLAPAFVGGMTYERLESLGGIRWPCVDESDPGATFLHGRLWQVPRVGRAAPFSVVHHSPPFEERDADYPLLLTTGRRLESYNTGVQTTAYDSPLHTGETLDLSPEDAALLGIATGDMVRVTSRRGSVVAPARIDEGLREHLVFMTFHFPDDVLTNALTIDASDPRSGTAEFKACAVRVEKVAAAALHDAPLATSTT